MARVDERPLHLGEVDLAIVHLVQRIEHVLVQHDLRERQVVAHILLQVYFLRVFLSSLLLLGKGLGLSADDLSLHCSRRTVNLLLYKR